MSHPRDIILRPVISEKSHGLIDAHTYTFIVHPDADKPAVRSAVEEIWGVKVVAVNTSNRKGKTKLSRQVEGRRRNTKRGVVKLAPGDKIEIFETR